MITSTAGDDGDDGAVDIVGGLSQGVAAEMKRRSLLRSSEDRRSCIDCGGCGGCCGSGTPATVGDLTVIVVAAALLLMAMCRKSAAARPTDANDDEIDVDMESFESLSCV